ncbi:hypothetical protein PTKIN_Ptkin09bG0203300 [Pterospermum kingtungense]
MDLPIALKEYMVFSFATFTLVEPFGLAPYILKKWKSLISLFEIIDRVPKIEPNDNLALKPPNVYASIELKNVGFCYPTRPEMLVLSNFSLRVNGGQIVAFVGVSGTIISLIERFYDPVVDQVLLDGRDLKVYNLSLPHGYDVQVDMRGVDLTPGQKQRIAIAGVVLKNAPILSPDEASSSIESESSRVVQEALDTLIMESEGTNGDDEAYDDVLYGW